MDFSLDEKARDYAISVVGLPPEESDIAMETMFAFIAGGISEQKLYHKALEESRVREGIALRKIQSLQAENTKLKKAIGND